MKEAKILILSNFQLIRSGGVGSMSTFARVGALIAPFVPLLVSISSFSERSLRFFHRSYCCRFG